ncbi:GNAT family N-acetyltransferase [Aquimonas sp.]|jgi:ElaA protein|uniref:GNAT family N-acetyltransferase n=1 Tax=Aquimonas sp. TaxID=1872588 RepID=UPI0037C00CEC
MSSLAPLEFSCLPFEALDPYRLYTLLRLRVDVFVVEQSCAYPDLDGHDHAPGVRHLLGERAGQLLAAARLLPPGLSFDTPAIGRVVVAASARGLGLAHLLMRTAIAQCEQLWPGQDQNLSAQAHLQGFYAAHGFVACSEPYLEDGIPHVGMRRSVALPSWTAG